MQCIEATEQKKKNGVVENITIVVRQFKLYGVRVCVAMCVCVLAYMCVYL